MGGTFDPVHIGHTETAQEALQLLELDELYLMPCQYHPHSKQPGASPSQRLEMLELALSDYPQLMIDNRELQRDSVSYTVDSLRDIQKNHGENMILCFLLGVDAFASLTTWYQWERLLEFSNLVVLDRAGYQSSEAVKAPELKAMLANAVEKIVTPTGSVQRLQLTPYKVSSTQIRQELAEEVVRIGMDSRVKASNSLTAAEWGDKLSHKVKSFIDEHGLYRF